MKTQIFKNISEFKSRKDKTINGVSETFAKNHPNYEIDNEGNAGCWNCTNCTNCTYCTNCTNCTDCTDTEN